MADFLRSLTLISLTIGLGEAVISGFFKEIYRFSLPFAYSMIIIADVFLFVFAEEITGKGKKAIVPLIIFFIAITSSKKIDEKFSLRTYNQSTFIPHQANLRSIGFYGNN